MGTRRHVKIDGGDVIAKNTRMNLEEDIPIYRSTAVNAHFCLFEHGRVRWGDGRGEAGWGRRGYDQKPWGRDADERAVVFIVEDGVGDVGKDGDGWTTGRVLL